MKPAQAADEPSRWKLKLSGPALFNTMQVEGIDCPPPEGSRPPLRESRNPALDAMVSRVAAGPAHTDHGKAGEAVAKPKVIEGRHIFYNYDPALDIVNVPAFERFDRAESFYLVLLLGLARWTGHPKRLGRTTDIQGENHPFEDVIAMLAAAFLAEDFGIVTDGHQQAASYIQHATRALGKEELRSRLLEAAEQAENAVGYLRLPSPGPGDATSKG